MIPKTIKILLLLMIFSGCKSVVEKESKLDNGLYYIASDISRDKLKLGFDIADSLSKQLICSSDVYEWKLHHREGLTFNFLTKDMMFLSLFKVKDVYYAGLTSSRLDESDWIIQEYDDERYKIINKKYKLCMNLKGQYSDLLRPVTFAKSNNNPYEFWHLVKMD
ncbi:MAG: hypothetical protein V2I47_03790 [Bacteroidales bacterium]|jgi:hypothetical protein|nr:hypothetical protein [Bacteroidales bacterium]